MGAFATGYPLFPSVYVAGTITIAAGNTVYNLFDLIRTQLDLNCPGAGYEITISSDDTGSVYVGCQTPIGGPLSTTNYGYQLPPGSYRTYRSGVSGAHSPVGNLQVLMAAAGTMHVEVTN